eukprot:gb/GEZJ01002699.1/.p1 GENE.gb/GEZJ01002699.1/~~gb/GEZJ01002699.1/.p1  ORF type:complete len:116 (-),score=1.21 gb/GEZJ01002699.1/:1341-1688(-)
MLGDTRHGKKDHSKLNSSTTRVLVLCQFPRVGEVNRYQKRSFVSVVGRYQRGRHSKQYDTRTRIWSDLRSWIPPLVVSAADPGILRDPVVLHIASERVAYWPIVMTEWAITSRYS